MAELKTLLELSQEAQARDLPFITTIKADLTSLIDDAMAAETEYKVIYDINTTLIGTDGSLQTTRIKNTIITLLQEKGYKASLQTENLVESLVITWVVATLTTSL